MKPVTESTEVGSMMVGDLDPAQNQAGSKLGANSKSGEKPLKKHSVPKHVASKPSSSEHPNFKAGAIRSPSSNQTKHPKSAANKPKVAIYVFEG